MLDVILFSPLMIAFVIWFGNFSEKSLEKIALSLAVIHLALTSSLFFLFDKSSSQLQLVTQFPWIESFGINYFIGIDGLSFWLVFLTSFLTILVAMIAPLNVHKNKKGLLTALFVLETSLLGCFLSIDSILFYVFFEASLIPMYFIIGIWGGSNRLYATVKFFLFTMLGSVFMLIGLISLILLTKEQFGTYSASLLDFYKLKLPFISGTVLSTQSLIFLSFSLSFAIKVPLFPFHTWLPDAHVEAPTVGSVLLAGVMLKVGAYGFLRFVLPLFTDSVEAFSQTFLLLSVIGIIYGALVAMVQKDMKKLVAYSSVSHMGYVMLGLFSFTHMSLTGSLYQMLNHGISTAALFFLVGMIYEKTHDKKILNYEGLALRAPIFTIYFLIITFSAIAVPMTNGFVGEFLILAGSFKSFPIFTAFAVLGVILSACYMLIMCKRMFFGLESPFLKTIKENLDIGLREKMVLLPLVVLVFWMGIYPKHFLMWSEESLEKLSLSRKKQYRLSVLKSNKSLKKYKYYIGSQK